MLLLSHEERQKMLQIQEKARKGIWLKCGKNRSKNNSCFPPTFGSKIFPDRKQISSPVFRMQSSREYGGKNESYQLTDRAVGGLKCRVVYARETDQFVCSARKTR